MRLLTGTVAVLGIAAALAVALGMAVLVLAVMGLLLWFPPLAAHYLHQWFTSMGWWSQPVLLWAAITSLLLALDVWLDVTTHR